MPVDETAVAETPAASNEDSASSESIDTDVDLLDALKTWRTSRYKQEGVKAYQVATNKCLEAITETMPTTMDEVQYTPGIGPAKAKKYGDDIIEIVRQYL